MHCEWNEMRMSDDNSRPRLITKNMKICEKQPNYLNLFVHDDKLSATGHKITSETILIKLNNNCIKRIFDHLSLRDLCIVNCVCKQFQ